MFKSVRSPVLVAKTFQLVLYFGYDTVILSLYPNFTDISWEALGYKYTIGLSVLLFDILSLITNVLGIIYHNIPDKIIQLINIIIAFFVACLFSSESVLYTEMDENRQSHIATKIQSYSPAASFPPMPNIW